MSPKRNDGWVYDTELADTAVVTMRILDANPPGLVCDLYGGVC